MAEPLSDCVIVGGGIGGAVLALSLARRGRRVTILEREAHPSVVAPSASASGTSSATVNGQTPVPASVARPEILAASTIQTFRALGLDDARLREASLPLAGLELRRIGGEPLLTLSAEDFAHAGVQPYSTDPARTRQWLLEAAAATGAVDVRHGVEAQGLIMAGSRCAGVRATRAGTPVEFRAPLVVGDDGGQSRVRASLGLVLQTRELPLEFLGAVVPAALNQRPGLGQGWINPDGLHDGFFAGLFLPLPGERTALVFLLAHAAAERCLAGDPSAFFAAVERLSPLGAGLARHIPFPRGLGRFRRPFGHAPRYVADGAALLGDAAHPVTPAGGQGANMSVADAVALAEVADAALAAGDCSAARLRAYETQRRPANARSLQFSVRTHRVLCTLQVLPWLASPALAYVRRVNRRPATKHRLLRALAQSFQSR